jgi:peptide/nickel transport system substrate-binding protein
MRRLSKIVLAMLLICTLVLSVFACGTTDTSDTDTSDTPSTSNVPDAGDSPDGTDVSDSAPAKDTVTIAVTQDSGTLDPTLISGNDILYAVQLVFDQLWYTDENGDEVMMLATEKERLDELTFRVHLREGVTFTNGNAFEADDVLFSLDHANNRFGQPAIVPQLDVENSKIIDPYTIDLVFTEYRITLMQSIGGLSMFDKQTSETDPETMSTRLVGTGPYIISEYVVNSHLNLTQKDEYWGTMPSIKNYSFVQLKEESQRVNAIETGEADVADIPYQDIEYVKSLSGVKVDQAPSFMGSGLYFNIAASSIFHENPDARRAVAYAVDRNAINTLAYSGTGTIPNAPVDGTATDGDERMSDMGIYAGDYDPELAQQLAESSGLTGKTVRLINNGSSAAALTSELIQADCKKVGITVDVISLDMGTWITNMYDETYYDMYIDGIPISPESYSGTFLFCYGYMAAMSYVNYDFNGKDRVWEILGTVLAIDDVQERIAMNNELAKICADDMLWLNLVSPSSAFGMSADLQGSIRNAYNVASLFRNLSWG